MNIRAAAHDELQWVEQRAPCVLTRDARGVLAEDSRGVTVGMVAFDGWTPSSAQMHVAIEKPIAVRSLKPEVFGWFFGEMPGGLAKRIAYGMVRASNVQALRFDTHLGFRPVARLKDGWATGEDMIGLELRREDYHG